VCLLIIPSISIVFAMQTTRRDLTETDFKSLDHVIQAQMKKHELPGVALAEIENSVSSVSLF